MKFNELKNVFYELKRVENEFNLPLTKPQKQNLLEQKEKYCNILKKYNSLFLVNGKTLKDRLNDYFKSKNTVAKIEYYYTRLTYTTKHFDTHTAYYTYMRLLIFDDDFDYGYGYDCFKVAIKVKLKSHDKAQFYDGDFTTNILDILNGFYNKEVLGKLYENYYDMLDVLWDIVLQNIKALNQEKILNNQQQEKGNLIVELTDTQIVANKVAKIEEDTAALEKEKECCSFDELDNII